MSRARKNYAGLVNGGQLNNIHIAWPFLDAIAFLASPTPVCQFVSPSVTLSDYFHSVNVFEPPYYSVPG